MILQAQAVLNPWSYDIGILLYTVGMNNRREAVVLPFGKMVLKEVKEHTPDIEPTLSLDRETIQSLVDTLAEIGFVSSKSKKEAEKFGGVLDATKYHLEDMRKIVFEKGGKDVRS